MREELVRNDMKAADAKLMVKHLVPVHSAGAVVYNRERKWKFSQSWGSGS
jgi:hypothetical protein